MRFLKSVFAFLCPYGLVKMYLNYCQYGTIFVPSNINTKKYWDKKLSEISDFWRDESYHQFQHLLPTDRKFSLLDIGCAIGDGCEWLSRKFPKAIISGVDISTVGIEKARSKNSGANYFVLDIEKDPIPGLYDYIIIVETLEHCEHPFFVVDKCLRHTICSLFVSVPYSPNMPSGRIKGRGEHLWAFNEQTFSSYNARVVLTDVLNEGTMPRIIYEIKAD